MTSTRRATPLLAAQRERVLDLLDRRATQLVREEPLGGEWAPVTRLRFDDGTSVIVKTLRRDGGEHGGADHLRRGAEALELLDGTGVAPSMLARDHDLVVMTDAGETTLEATLLADDPDDAARAIVALADAIGRMHAATTDAGRGRDPEHEVWSGVDRWDEIDDATRRFGFPDPARARGDVEWVRRQLADPGLFLALTHLDLSPPNVIGGQLVDFEGAGFRHIGLDAAWLHFPFPNYSAHYAVLPDDLVRVANAVYRERIAAAIPEARDDGAYNEMLTAGCAACLVVRTHRLDRLSADGQSRHDSWRRRTQLHQQIGVFTDLSRRTGYACDLAAWFQELAEAMVDRWPDTNDPPPPRFPAFQPASTSSPRCGTER